MTTNREICLIRAASRMAEIDPTDIDLLVSELNKKYGLNDKADGPPARLWNFGPNHEVNLSIFNGVITLLYRYDKLLDPVQQASFSHHEEEFKKTLGGI
jgi:hypothetical protein